MNAKDKLPKKYTRCSLQDSVYVGETGKFQRRLQRNVSNKHVAANALANTGKPHNDNIDWNSAAILAQEINTATGLLVESPVIQTTPDTVNRTEGNMPGIYA